MYDIILSSDFSIASTLYPNPPNMAALQNSDTTFDGRYTQPKLPSGRVHPYLIYGTGFKEDRTEALTGLALANGFQGLDSANYPTAYQEEQVGKALQTAPEAGVKRDDILVCNRRVLTATNSALFSSDALLFSVLFSTLAD